MVEALILPDTDLSDTQFGFRENRDTAFACNLLIDIKLKSMCISVTGVKLWNSFDNSLISCKNVHHFKKCYTNRLLNNYVLES